MTKIELKNRILVAWEQPNCVMDWKVPYAEMQDGLVHCSPGVAIMMAGQYEIPLDRGKRAELLDLEWSYLLHMEQALTFLFCGNVYSYNECVLKADEPDLVLKPHFFRFKIEYIYGLLLTSQ